MINTLLEKELNLGRNFKNFLILFLCFYSTIVFGESRVEIWKDYKIVMQCQKPEENCDFSVYDAQSKRVFKTNIFLYFPRLRLEYHDDKFLEVRHSFGTNDTFSYFFDLKHLRMSAHGFQDVMAVDPNHGVVAYAEEDEILVQKIFSGDENVYKIKRNFYSTSGASVFRADSYFTKEGKLFLTYTANENNEPDSKTELIDIPGSILNSND